MREEERKIGVQPQRAAPIPSTAEGPAASRAALDVLAERRRQIEVEGWGAAHDDRHTNGSLAWAASCYARGQIETRRGSRARGIPAWSSWPWDIEWWKPKDRRHDLVRAAALIIAEIERLDRASEAEGPDAVEEQVRRPSSAGANT